MSSHATNIPTLHRPIFDGLDSDEAKFKAAMAEYDLLKDTDPEGLDFSNKTAMWIAYERHVESKRDDCLFHDPLARHFIGSYGKRLSDAMSFGLAYSCFDPPGADIGFGLEGHVMYTAARTRLVNEKVDRWMEEHADEKCQVLNLGVGMDTRVYWLQSLKHSKCTYWEIDTPSIMNHKWTILNRLESKGETAEELCQLQSIAMDFSNESIADLPSKYSYDATIPSCWILEGLIMYLKRDAVEELLNDMSALSAPGSLLILNFSNSPAGDATSCPPMDEIHAKLVEHKNWNQKERLMFGDPEFNYGRYPQGRPANKVLGFAMYQKKQ